MSSPAAAAISAMITSQVYPQYRWPAPKPRRPVPQPPRRAPGQQPKARTRFLKGYTKVIGYVQVAIGAAVLGLACVTLYETVDISSVAFVVSALCLISGLVSLLARGKRMIRVTLLANIVSFLTSFFCILIYSYPLFLDCPHCDPAIENEGPWLAHTVFAKFGLKPLLKALRIVVITLSSLNLLVTILCMVYGYKALHHADSQEAISTERDGWRDGLRSPTDENMLMSNLILTLDPKIQQP